MNATERLWLPNNANECNRTSQSCAEAWWVPREAWLNVQKRRQSWLDRHQSWLGISKTASRRSNTVMERQWRQPVACSRNSTTRPVCAALDGDSRRCQYAYLQSSTIDGARWHSMTDRYFTGAWRQKFWTFQNFRTATVGIGAQWRSAAFTHGCVCALWRSTASIHGFWTAAERRQKPPMCNSGFTDDKSTLVQVMAWCHQATSHYLSQCWPRSLSPYGITRPQWVKYNGPIDHCPMRQQFLNERGNHNTGC